MSHQEGSWDRIIIFLIANLCTFFLFISCYNFIRRRFCLPVAPNRQLPNEGVGAEGQPPQLQTHQGLSPDIVRALPAVQFKKMKDVETGWIDCDCAVCLGEFEDGEWLRLLPVCAHVFHSSCVDAWFQTHSNCPLCRSSVVHGLNSDIDCS